MIWFWLTAAALTLGSCVAMLLGALRGRRGTDTAVAAGTGAAAPDMSIYRDQLAEIERDAGRGVIAADEAQRLRAEVARRLLEADRIRKSARHLASGPGIGATVLVILVMAAGGIGLYRQLGAPGYPDMPLALRKQLSEDFRANRQSQAEAEASVPPAPEPQDIDPDFLELMARLRNTAAERPLDARGQQLLAQNEARLGRFGPAWRAQDQLIGLQGENAGAADYAALAELMIYAAGGYVSPEAEQALANALKLNPKEPRARFYSGLMLAQIGRPDLAFPLWRDLLASLPPGAPWERALRDDLPALAALAGVEYELPPAAETPQLALPGPDADAVAAAAELTGAEQTEMVRGMVDRLNDRLAREGGTAAEWARLISSLGILGETERARAIHDEAQSRFAGNAADLAVITGAARAAGVTP